MIHPHDSASGLPYGCDPQELDRTMVRVPAGEFPYGITDEERRAAASDAGVHVDQLRFHPARRTMRTGEF